MHATVSRLRACPGARPRRMNERAADDLLPPPASEGYIVSSFTTWAPAHHPFESAARAVLERMEAVQARHGFADRDLSSLRVIVHRLEHVERARGSGGAFGAYAGRLSIVAQLLEAPSRAITLTGHFVRNL